MAISITFDKDFIRIEKWGNSCYSEKYINLRFLEGVKQSNHYHWILRAYGLPNHYRDDDSLNIWDF